MQKNGTCICGTCIKVSLLLSTYSQVVLLLLGHSNTVLRYLTYQYSAPQLHQLLTPAYAISILQSPHCETWHTIYSEDFLAHDVRGVTYIYER